MSIRMYSLFDHYRARHEMGGPLLQGMGMLGCIAFSLLHVLGRASFDPGFDERWLRLPAIALCLGLALRQWWPTSLKPYYIAYSWWVVFFCLSFLPAYTLLGNGGGTPFVVHMVMGAVLIVLLADGRNTVALLLLGWVGALGIRFGLEASPAVPTDFMFAVAGSLLLVTGGALAHKGQQRVEIERLRRYAGLASSIANEMRTPLAVVQNALRGIDADASPGPEATRAAQQAHSAIQRGLQSIFITLQQVSRRQPMQSELLLLSAEQCVRKALDDYAYDSPQVRERVQLRVDGDFNFRGDATTFELVLFNLLKNALYYLPLHPKMEVWVTIKADPRPCIAVRDSGPGVAPEFVRHLFEEFRTHGKAEGTGVGLSFCRRTMRMMGGDIRCSSKPGRGTKFTLSFPRCAGIAEPPPARSPAGPSEADRTAQTVDDQPLNRSIARALVGEPGQQVLDPLKAGAPQAASSLHQFELLDMKRLENFRRLELLDELLPRALFDLRLHVVTLERAAAADKRETVMDTLQALVGLSGEIGAQLLHARVLDYYTAWREERDISGAGWILDLRAVLKGTEHALLRLFNVRAAEAPSPAPPA